MEDGPGEMPSAQRDKKRGFTSVLSTEDLVQVNRLRRSKRRLGPEHTPGTRSLSDGDETRGLPRVTSVRGAVARRHGPRRSTTITQASWSRRWTLTSGMTRVKQQTDLTQPTSSVRTGASTRCFEIGSGQRGARAYQMRKPYPNHGKWRTMFMQGVTT